MRRGRYALGISVWFNDLSVSIIREGEDFLRFFIFVEMSGWCEVLEWNGGGDIKGYVGGIWLYSSMVKSVITIDRLDGSMVKRVIDNVHRYRGVIDMYVLVKGVSYKG
ncbi:hypothetical protein CWI36_0509p0040 [Hamiltosporidium magnivora]|uniref:Uncharacterized protein n=1 Tax=Hamiltosporidium magnivora TaxID=148818 RepID=A0A4Q9LDX4_9MICR|nr:hypothetical protein CWI36_0509p0040 [Hamiltosporidium magnivora]